MSNPIDDWFASAFTPATTTTTPAPSAPTTTVADASPSASRPAKTRIEDYGEHIGGARKDEYENVKALFSDITYDLLSDTSKKASDVLTMPDFRKMYNDGTITASQACAAYAMWRQIKPRTCHKYSYQISGWAYFTLEVLDRVRDILNGVQGTDHEELIPFITKHSHHYNQTQVEYNVLRRLNYPIDDYSFGSYCIIERGYGDQKGYSVSTRGTTGHYLTGKFDDYGEIGTVLKDMLQRESEYRKKKRDNKPTDSEDTIKPIELSYWTERYTGKAYCTPKKKKLHHIHLMEWKDADTMKKEWNDPEVLNRIYAEYWRLANIPNERHTLNRNRVGKEWLPKDKQILPADLAAEYKFRGIEFGNWCTQDERSQFLNATYEALHDLQEILNLTPDGMTCDGNLAIAFGARGRGGKALAHYEPLRKVINLTKLRGAGSLAHEWFHAVDHFASQGSPLLLTDRADRYNNVSLPKAAQSAQWLVTKMKELPYYKRCRKVDALKDKAYWSTPCEMAARAFETLVIALLDMRGWRSDFLASVTDYASWGNPDTYVYPTPDELKELAPWIEKYLFEVFHVRHFLYQDQMDYLEEKANAFLASRKTA